MCASFTDIFTDIFCKIGTAQVKFEIDWTNGSRDIRLTDIQADKTHRQTRRSCSL